MKQLFTIAVILWLGQPGLLCQPVDIMVKNIYCHEVLDNGTQSGNKYTCVQKTYDNNNHLVLERFYDDRLQKQVGYRWYFYDAGGRVKSIEKYNMDRRPESLFQVMYTDAGDTLKVIEYTGDRETITKTSEKNFFYSSSGLLRQIRTLIPSSKVIETTKYAYKSGLKQPVRITRDNRSASPFKEKVKIIYADTTGLPQSAIRQMHNVQTKKKYSVQVSYNRKGNPVEEKYMAAGKPFKRKLFEYAADIELEKYYEEDGQGKLTALYTVDTYWHKANLNMKSYFE